LSLVVGAGTAIAGGVFLEKKNLQSIEGAWVLNAQFRVELSKKAEESLKRGVPLSFLQSFELVQKHEYWLDENKVAQERRYQLSYAPLLNRYRLKTDAGHSDFDSLGDALQAVGNLSDWAIGRIALSTDKRYEARLRLYLEMNRLPQTLQLRVLLSPHWDLDSGWQEWSLAL